MTKSLHGITSLVIALTYKMLDGIVNGLAGTVYRTLCGKGADHLLGKLMLDGSELGNKAVKLLALICILHTLVNCLFS